ncbi:MATE family efflux transporter [Photobacterium carnosum]|uniref:Multidrug resistance protein NorM n=1 Tax=Photobacterium carnosum TaxID=2023717 RepID=A0A2N4UQD0_9GAMM|nr:MATE family efflux transporter [Photobacterium carnosum]MCD9522437.1 MATE family efflux transporter [Photobacterium carnosum]MCD9550205.1 MATE family efflux transporter [Photobacterium carnosum]MCF2307339.1 MATE family efflux transporter [Photobacterium carnosum]PLC57221.1 MATE family efflux transporter [Photobacterium carnosum]
MNAKTITASHSHSLAHQLFTMTWPMLFGVLSLMSFQLVDSAFIGQLGILPLAAQGFTLPMQMLVIGLQVGLGIATTALISRVLGNNDHHRARQLGGVVVILGDIGIMALCAAIWFGRHQLLWLLGAPDNVFGVIDSYWPVWLTSAWCGSMVYFAYSICRANGNTLLPGIMMVITSVINIGLDPLFMFTFNMGINGAAWATIVSFSLGMLVVFPLLIKRQWLSFDWRGLAVYKAIQELVHIMAPAMLSQLLPPVSAILATKLVAGFGAATVAAWALGSRLEFFSLVIVLALTMSMPPMVGRLLGRKDIVSIEKLIMIAVRFILVWQVVIAVILFLSAQPLAQLLTTNTSVQQILMIHLTRVPISLGALGICMLMVSVCNAMGLPMRALLISALRLFVCYLPVLWIGAHYSGLSGLFTGAMLGNIAAGLCAWVFYRQGLTNIRNKYRVTSMA